MRRNFSIDEVKELLNAEKWVVKNGQRLQFASFTLKQSSHNFELVSNEFPKLKFKLSSERSGKKTTKFKLFVIENESTTGLLRICFRADHRNPAKAPDDLPMAARDYVGYKFEDESHVHIHVPSVSGPQMPWAIPLSDYTDFTQKEVNSTEEWLATVEEFRSLIALQTRFEFTNELF